VERETSNRSGGVTPPIDATSASKEKIRTTGTKKLMRTPQRQGKGYKALAQLRQDEGRIHEKVKGRDQRDPA